MSDNCTEKVEFSEIHDRIGELYHLAERHFLKSFPRPAVRVDLTGQTAGQAWLDKNLLRLNRQLFLENHAHFLKHTIGHEVAHLIAHQLFGQNIRPHGKEWSFVMEMVFNLPARRTHSYNTERVTRRPYLYRCQCKDKTIPLTAIRHNRALKGTIYLCTTCKSSLVFTGDSSNMS